MKYTTNSLIVLFSSLAVGTGLQAATMSVNPGVPPTVDGDDIASLGGTVDIGGNEGHAWSNRPRQGQTFTTGSNPAGYVLDAYSIRVRVDQAGTIAPNWEVRVGSVDGGGVFSQIALENAAGVTIPNSTAGNDFPAYLTFALDTPLVLAANSTYGIDLYPNGGGFISLSDSTDPYPGGAAYSAGSPASGVFPDNPLTQHGADRAFHVNLTAVPEPSAAALLGLMGLGFLARRRRR